MKLKDQFRFVRQNMRKNRTRVYMTILATAMGCAFLIVLASVGFGLHKSVVKDITETRIVTQIDVPGSQEKDGDFHPVTEKEIKSFEKINGVKAVTRRKMLQQEGNYDLNGFQTNAQTLVTDMPSEVKAGFELSKGRLPEKKNEIMVGYHFANYLASENAKTSELFDEKDQVKEEFHYNGNLLGEELALTVNQFVEGEKIEKTILLTVVGIGKKPTKEWVEDRNVFISNDILLEIEEFTGTSRGMLNDPNMGDMSGSQVKEDNFDEVKIYATNMEAVEGIVDTLKDRNFHTYSVVNELKQVNMLFTIVKAGLIFIGTVAILIASIGIYNTMTMAVTERASDIGIMKAIGANPKTIKRIFLLESSYIGIIGAIIGTIVSYGISYTVNFALPLIIEKVFEEKLPDGLMFSYIPYSLPLICVLICYVVTLMSGYRPAQRATKVDVLKAMRREI